MSGRIIKSKRALKKLKHLPVDVQEPSELRKVRTLSSPLGAGSKGARQRMGRLETAELGTVAKDSPGSVVYTASNGAVCELDVRGIEENAAKRQSIANAQFKEKVRFRMAILMSRMDVYYFDKVDQTVIKTIVTLFVQGTPVSELPDHNPYNNKNYVDLWNYWCGKVAAVA